MKAAGLGRLKPGLNVTAGDHVDLGAEDRHEEIVNDVLRGQRQFHRPVDGQVQFVDLALAVGMLDLPHPLFADDEHLRGVRRRLGHRGIDLRSPHEHDEEDEQRRDGPEPFEAIVAEDARRALVLAAAAIPERRRRAASRATDTAIVPRDGAEEEEQSSPPARPWSRLAPGIGVRRQTSWNPSIRSPSRDACTDVNYRCVSGLSLSRHASTSKRRRANTTTVSARARRTRFNAVIVYLPVSGS